MSAKNVLPIRQWPHARPIKRCRNGLAVLLLALLMPVHAEPTRLPDRPLDQRVAASAVDQLKRDYLLCNRAAINGRLNTAGIMQCSIIYEQLKDLAFDGDFDRLHAWSKQSPVPR